MSPHRIAPIAMGLLFVLIGLVVGTAGVWLMALGGSWYYLPAGLMMVLTGLLLLQGSPSALWAHAALLATTLAWSLWESGLDGWALAARSNVVWLLGLVMLTPWFTRGLDDSVPVAARRGLATALASFAAVGLGAALYSSPATDRTARADSAAVSLGVSPKTALVADGAMVRWPAERSQHLAARALPAVLEAPEMLSSPLPPTSTCPSVLLVPAAQGRLVAFDTAEGSDCTDTADAGGEGGDGQGLNVIEFPPFKGFIDQVSWHAAADALHGGAGSPALSGADMWGLTLFDQLACRIAFEKMRFDGRFARPMAMGLLMQMPQPGGRELVASGPSALVFTAEVVTLPSDAASRRLSVPAAGAPLMIRATAPALAAGPAHEAGSSPAAPYGVRLQPFLSPIGLPCQAPPWRLHQPPAAQRVLQQPPAGSVVPGYLRSGRPVAAAEADAPAL
ncbi:MULTISPECIES: hypothetical protein [unclassified Acidovorax]|uniref:hypothetical protein n=1 Tax=unclassified Acidovorax TaxID=2684926 RepID=UPI0028834B91|nr:MULTISPECIES: hypothetical protein [unclassified Acidovorax]